MPLPLDYLTYELPVYAPNSESPYNPLESSPQWRRLLAYNSFSKIPIRQAAQIVFH
jgi:hypothetical protein